MFVASVMQHTMGPGPLFGASTLVQHPPSGVLSMELGPLLGGNIGGR
jgi:hypothetical protein